MLLTEIIAAQAELLFCQRLTLTQNRYVGLAQLTQHDYRLFDCLHALQQTVAGGVKPDSALPCWLDWLMQEEINGLFSIKQLQQFASPQQAWLLLHQLKYRHQPSIISRLMQHSAAGDTAESELAWQFACRQRLALMPLLPAALQNGTASPATLCYLGSSGQQNLLPLLQQFIQQARQQSGSDQRVLSAALLASYLLKQPCEELELVKCLTQTGLLSDIALMLIMIGAADKEQARIINYLSGQSDGVNHTLRAMAYSGQLKFVPLLLELTQHSDSAEAGANALAVLLGVLEADTLLTGGDAQAVECGKGQKKLAGFDIATEQLAIILRQGNQQQRQLASCHRFNTQPGSALAFVDVLAGSPTYDH